jgi:ABC-type phosphate transport system auxiliary subunit
MTTTKEVSTMSEVQDLRQRRQALETQLSALRVQRERAFRVNSDALSRQRVGVTYHDAADMQPLATDEVAGDSAMADLRREIELIDDELARDHGGGLAGKGRRIMRWLRK